MSEFGSIEEICESSIRASRRGGDELADGHTAGRRKDHTEGDGAVSQPIGVTRSAVGRIFETKIPFAFAMATWVRRCIRKNHDPEALACRYTQRSSHRHRRTGGAGGDEVREILNAVDIRIIVCRDAEGVRSSEHVIPIQVDAQPVIRVDGVAKDRSADVSGIASLLYTG